MAIVVTDRPYQFCFTGNPVFYRLFTNVTNPDVYIEVRLRYRFLPDGGYIDLPAIPFYPSDGYVSIDVKDLLDSVLEHQLPLFPESEITPYKALKQTAAFYIQFREIYQANLDPSWDDTESDFVCYGIKGGLSKGKFRGNNFWLFYYGTLDNILAPFFTWQKSGRLASIKERMYLAFLNVTDLPYLKSVVTVFFTDGTSAVVDRTVPVDKGGINYIPAGASQWELQELSPAKKILYWQVQMWDENLVVQISQAFRYYADNRNNYNDVTLHYRNSFGCLDSVRIRGVITKQIDYNINEQDITIEPDYYSGHFIQPLKAIANKTENLTYKGDVGYLEKEEQDRLRDLQLSKDAWWEIEKKWWPVLITTPNLNSFNSSDDKRWTMPVEWKLAFNGEEYYTPDSVNLGDGVFTNNVCMAFLTGVSYSKDLSGSEAVITVSMTENDPGNASAKVRYRVLGYINWTEVDYGDITFNLPKDVTPVMELQAVCTNNICGKKTTLQIDTRISPPDPGNECIIGNNTGIADMVTIKVNGITEVDNQYLGAHSYFTFNVEDAVGATVEIELVNISPSWVDLYSGINGYNPTISNHTVVFTDVTIENGMNIQIT